MIREISADEANARRAAGATLVDVREQVEWDAGHIAGSTFIPLGVVLDQIESAVPDKDRELVIYCRSGARSGKAVDLLRKAGFQRIRNMTGGILAWSDKVDPSVPKY